MPKKVKYKNFQLFIRANFKNKHLLNFKSIRITPKTSYSPHAKKHNYNYDNQCSINLSKSTKKEYFFAQ